MHSLLDISHSLIQSQIQSLSIQLTNQLAQNKSTLRVNLRLSRDGQLFLELRRAPTKNTRASFDQGRAPIRFCYKTKLVSSFFQRWANR